MRSVSATMKRKLASRIQAGDNALSASLWVGRPTTPLTEDRFLERQTILSSKNITKTSIAVCHPRLMRGATEVYIGYLESGTIKIAKTTYVEEMERHVWERDIGYSQVADDFCLCFDGTMPKAPNGYVEFKTEQLPWVFWTLNGVLYARKMFDTSEPFILAEANCSAVSAVRAMWSAYGSFDFGIVVFFILNGKLHYRQYIRGEWMDAEVVSFGPSGVLWEAVAAFRTWDYRIGVQLKSTNGAFYEMFTQFMGVGKQNSEHIEISYVKPESDLIEVNYTNARDNEHIELANVTAGAPYGGLYGSTVPRIMSVHNEDDGTGDWGKIVAVTFDVHLNASTIAANAGCFTLVDTNGAIYMASEAVLDIETAKTITLTFTDFNAAFGVCQLKYVPGTIKSLADTSMEQVQFAFMPENLNPPQIDPPEPVEIWNVGQDGEIIRVRFTEAIVSDPADNEEKFEISANMYNMVPGGTLNAVSRSVVQTKAYAGIETALDITNGNFNNVVIDEGALTLEEVDDNG